jgi:hypothetical protein
METVSALRTSALALLLALAPTAALAQTTFHMEVAVSAGYRTGGSLTESTSGATYDIESSSSFGAVADVQLVSPGLFVEVAWTRQESSVPAENAFGKGLNEVSLDSFLVGGQWDMAPRSAVRPFLAALVGATRIEAPGSSTTQFTATLSGGVKLMATDSFGVRLEARAIGIFSGGSASGLCGPAGCTIGMTGWGTLQADFSGGVLLGF